MRVPCGHVSRDLLELVGPPALYLAHVGVAQQHLVAQGRRAHEVRTGQPLGELLGGGAVEGSDGQLGVPKTGLALTPTFSTARPAARTWPISARCARGYWPNPSGARRSGSTAA